ncbi:MAG: hypothetical protein U0Z53_23910 [Blastocatellia bacterium]
MKAIIFTLFLLLWVSAIANPLTQSGLPPAPEGFAWQKLEEIKGAALVPNGWFFKKEEKKGTLAYFITQEDIDKGGWYDTGLSIQVFRQPQPNTAEEVARTILQGHNEKKELLKSWKTSAGKMNGWGYQAKVKGANGKVTMVHSVIFSNPETKTFYWVLFESTEEKWQEALKIGEKLQMIAFNDKV